MNNCWVDACSGYGISWIRYNFQREFYFRQCSIHIIHTAPFPIVRICFLVCPTKSLYFDGIGVFRYIQVFSGDDMLAMNTFPRHHSEIIPCFHGVAVSYRKVLQIVTRCALHFSRDEALDSRVAVRDLLAFGNHLRKDFLNAACKFLIPTSLDLNLLT